MSLQLVPSLSLKTMSQSESTSERVTTPEDRHEGPTALGSRENFWGQEQNGTQQHTGHSELAGTEEAEYIARQLVQSFVEPICTTTLDETPNRGFAPHFAYIFDGEPLGKGSDLDAMHKENRAVELSEPCFHIPKQHDTGNRIVENRQHRHRRRYNPETGYINWGETTSTGIPHFQYEVYDQCVNNYLSNRLRNALDSDGDGLTITKIEEYQEHADCLWHDPSMDSLGSLIKFVEHVREKEDIDGVSN